MKSSNSTAGGAGDGMANSNNTTDQVAPDDTSLIDQPKSPRSRKDRKFASNKRRGLGRKKNSGANASEQKGQASSANLPESTVATRNGHRAKLDPAAAEHISPKDSEQRLLNIIENDEENDLDNFIERHPYEMAIRYESGLTPLLMVVRDSHIDYVSTFVDKILALPRMNVNEKDKKGRTALHIASWRGLDDVAKSLLAAGAKIDACDNDNATALHLAVMQKHSSVVKLLLSRDANPNATTARKDPTLTAVKGGLTPLHIAAFRGYQEIMKTLLDAKHINVSPRDYGSGFTPLHEACRGCNSECEEDDERNHAEVASLLIENGADVNATTEEKFTPLHMAASIGRVTVVKVLMIAGADPSRYTSQQANAESLAPAVCRDEIASILHRRHRGSVSRPHLGTRLEIAQPRPDQESTCKEYKGFIWPSQKPERTSNFDACAIWDLLYRPGPLLNNRKDKTIWIHLPSSNRTWVEDVFKSLYDSGRLLESPITDRDGRRVLRDVLHFIKESFGETDHEQGAFQRPHFRTSKWSHARPNNTEQHMTSIVLPLIDVDMQQPEYFCPERMEQAWEQEVQLTGQFKVPPAPPKRPCGDAEPTVEMTKEAEQEAEEWENCVVRALTSWEGSPLSAEEKTHVKKAKTLKRVYSNIDHARTLDQSFHEHLEPDELNRRNGDQVLSRYLARTFFKHQKNEKSKKQTEKGDDDLMDPEIQSPVGSKIDIQDSERLQRFTSLNNLPRRGSTYLAPLQPDVGLKPKSEPEMRQQVLMVQSLRIWKFENIIVTSYPERLALSNRRTLPEIIRDIISRCHSSPVGSHTEYVRTQKVVEDIVEIASQFEPKFSVCARERTLNNAFAGEIAHVSSKVTRCYSQYQDILGRVESNFAKAVEKETSYLVMIDDILDEISMIKRVAESQDQVLLQIEQLKERKEHSGSTDENTPWHGFKKPFRDQCNDLERLEDDAKRVRKSVTTLLELRQRQASTENVVSLREQSEILFQQSKILFIFTGATVVFAPLSWINSMMALKINDMTPKSEWWERWQAFLSSFLGLVGTLALCLAFWLWAESKGNAFFTTPQMRAQLERNVKLKEGAQQGSKKDEPESFALSTRTSWASTVGKTAIGGNGR